MTFISLFWICLVLLIIELIIIFRIIFFKIKFKTLLNGSKFNSIWINVILIVIIHIILNMILFINNLYHILVISNIQKKVMKLGLFCLYLKQKSMIYLNFMHFTYPSSTIWCSFGERFKAFVNNVKFNHQGSCKEQHDRHERRWHVQVFILQNIHGILIQRLLNMIQNCISKSILV